MPVCCGDELLGAFTIYSTQGQAFTEMNAAVAEVVALGLAGLLGTSIRQPASERILRAARHMTVDPVDEPIGSALASSLMSASASKPC